MRGPLGGLTLVGTWLEERNVTEQKSKRTSLLRDPIWQFLGVVIGVIAILASYNIFVLQRPDRNFEVRILSMAPLLDIADEVKDDVEIRYQGQTVTDLTLILLEVQNVGKAPITASDFERDIRVGFGKEAKALGLWIVFASPPNLSPDVIWIGGEGLHIEGVLFNPGDRIVIKLILMDAGSQQIQVDTRIIGISEPTVILPRATPVPTATPTYFPSPLFRPTSTVIIP
jgi:hypothetical protein